MAYRRRGSYRRSSYRRSSYRAARKTSSRRSYSNRRARGSRAGQTVRIVLEQPAIQAPSAFQVPAAPPKRGRF